MIECPNIKQRFSRQSGKVAKGSEERRIGNAASMILLAIVLVLGLVDVRLAKVEV